MGDGVRLRCSKCKREYCAGWGIGFNFPIDYQNTAKAIKKGKYGEEWKSLYKKDEFVVFNAEDYVYSCRKCGRWDVEKGLSLYVPKDVSALKIKYNLKSDKELENRPYVMAYELKEEYKILKKRIHKCSKCGGVMKRQNDEENYHLPCPYCGGEPDEDSTGPVFWD